VAEKIHLVAQDNGIIIGVECSLDGVAQDLSAATIDAHLTDVWDPTSVGVISATGDADGIAYTELAAANLVPGEFWLEHEVTIGAQVITYPSKANDRIKLIIRPEAH
jgi:hypothetical protein